MHFYRTVGRSTVHIKIDSIEIDQNNSITEFRLYANCSLYIIAFALMGIVSRVLTSTLIESLSIVVVAVFLAGLGYIWSLYRAYKLGILLIPSLVYQALGQVPITSDNNQGPPDWIADLAKTR